jgi:hypothetical protein
MSEVKGASSQTDNVIDGEFASPSRELVLSFNEAESRRGNHDSIRQTIRMALRDDKLFRTVQAYLVPKGICGRKSFDQALAVQAIIDWDLKNGKKIADFKLDHARLWNFTYQVIGQVMLTSRGRLLGYQEPQAKTASPKGGASA